MIGTLFLSPNAEAALFNRGTDTLGNRLIYDDDLDITWYDYSATPDTWANQVFWAIGLSVTHNSTIYTDWRLPTTPGTIGWYTSEGEMGHLYYGELGKARGEPLGATDPFENLQASVYWYGKSDYSEGYNNAWYYNFDYGFQSSGDKNYYDFYGLAVRSGDVAVPEPTTIALLGIGLAGMTLYGIRRRRLGR